MIVGRHRKTKHLYRWAGSPSQFTGRMLVRSARTGRTYTIPSEMFEPYDETWRYLVTDPYEGEPDEEGGVEEPEQPKLAELMSTPTVFDAIEPQLPVVHELARSQSYSVGTAITLLSDIEPFWPGATVVSTLKACVLILQDEISRVQGDE